MNTHVCVQCAFVHICVCKHVTCVHVKLKRKKDDHNRPTKSGKKKMELDLRIAVQHSSYSQNP